MNGSVSCFSNLHDGELVSVTHHKRENKVSIRVDLPDGEGMNIILCGVKAFRVVDFISQNIISWAFHSDAENFDGPFIERLVRWVNSLSDGACMISQGAISNYVEKIRSGAMKVLAIEPSWGAELVCIYTEEESEAQSK